MSNEPRCWRFLVPGKPSGKARPRFAKGHIYSPDAGAMEARVQAFARMAGVELTGGSVQVCVTVHRLMPKSWSKKRKEREIWNHAAGRPDAANVEAAVHDALQGIAYHDDSQIAESSFKRFWADADSTSVFIESLER